MKHHMVRTLIVAFTVAGLLFASAAPALSVYADPADGRDKSVAPKVATDSGGTGGKAGDSAKSADKDNQGSGSAATPSSGSTSGSTAGGGGGGGKDRAKAAAPRSDTSGGGSTARDDGARTNGGSGNDSRPGTASNQSGPDDGDNKHPSGKDRSIERGGLPNGNSGSNPDENGRGPERTSSGGPDKPGHGGGVDKRDQDGNNGCGNDDDFEDDNEGWCGKPKAEAPDTGDGDGNTGGGNQDCANNGGGDANCGGNKGDGDQDCGSNGNAGCGGNHGGGDQDCANNGSGGNANCGHQGGNNGGDNNSGGDQREHEKLTVCHSTGSTSHPWVMITIDAHTLPAHLAHGDMTSVTSVEQCPSVLGETDDDEDAQPVQQTVTLCHRTGSSSMSWTIITVDSSLRAAFEAEGDFVVSSGTSASQCGPAPSNSGSGGGGGTSPVTVTLCYPTGVSANPWTLVTLPAGELNDHLSRGAFPVSSDQCAPAPSNSGGGGGNVSPATVTLCYPTGSSASSWSLVTLPLHGLSNHLSRGAFVAPSGMTSAGQCAPTPATGGGQASVPHMPTGEQAPAQAAPAAAVNQPTEVGGIIGFPQLPIEMPVLEVAPLAMEIAELPAEVGGVLGELGGVLETPVSLPLAGDIPLGAGLLGTSLVTLLSGALLRRRFK